MAAESRVWPLKTFFAIARGRRSDVHSVLVTVTDGPFTGRGECVPYARYGETIEGTLETIRAAAPSLPADGDPAMLQGLLPPGAARNALDCALWDLRAKKTRTPVAEMSGLPRTPWVLSAFTISVDTPAQMAQEAARQAGRKLLKVKLAGKDDLQRLEAVRHAAPLATLIVDANESWSRDDYLTLVPRLAALKVTLIEQPFPAGSDDAVQGLERPIPLCADESCHTAEDLDRIEALYDMVNIKLDKAGGFTGAMALMAEAQKRKLKVMVGCMLGSSLSVAPARLLAPGADLVDLDGPLLLGADHEPAIRYDGSLMAEPDPALWG